MKGNWEAGGATSGQWIQQLRILIRWRGSSSWRRIEESSSRFVKWLALSTALIDVITCLWDPGRPEEGEGRVDPERSWMARLENVVGKCWSWMVELLAREAFITGSLVLAILWKILGCDPYNLLDPLFVFAGRWRFVAFLDRFFDSLKIDKNYFFSKKAILIFRSSEFFRIFRIFQDFDWDSWRSWWSFLYKIWIFLNFSGFFRILTEIIGDPDDPLCPKCWIFQNFSGFWLRLLAILVEPGIFFGILSDPDCCCGIVWGIVVVAAVCVCGIARDYLCFVAASFRWFDYQEKLILWRILKDSLGFLRILGHSLGFVVIGKCSLFLMQFYGQIGCCLAGSFRILFRWILVRFLKDSWGFSRIFRDFWEQFWWDFWAILVRFFRDLTGFSRILANDFDHFDV